MCVIESLVMSGCKQNAGSIQINLLAQATSEAVLLSESGAPYAVINNLETENLLKSVVRRLGKNINLNATHEFLKVLAPNWVCRISFYPNPESGDTNLRGKIVLSHLQLKRKTVSVMQA